LSTQVNQ